MATDPKPNAALASDVAPPVRELDDYEKGYLDGVLAFAYWGDGVAYVGKGRLMTYETAVRRFLRSRGIENWQDWKVEVRHAS